MTEGIVAAADRIGQPPRAGIKEALRPLPSLPATRALSLPSSYIFLPAFPVTQAIFFPSSLFARALIQSARLHWPRLIVCMSTTQQSFLPPAPSHFFFLFASSFFC